MSAGFNWLRKRFHEGLNYRLRTFAGGRFASRCRPTSIAFLLTERCNARCVHCDIWKNRGKEDCPDGAEWKRVLDDLRSWLGPVHVFFTGGEALLKQDAPEIVAHARRIGLFVEVLTHGYWPDQKRIEALAESRPWRVTVSFDAPGPVHSLIRGREDFYERTSATIGTLLKLRQERGYDYVIRLKTVIMEQNLDEAVKMAEFATRDGMHVFYQPIEQNYNTPEDANWFLTSANWPRDSRKAIRIVRDLIALKQDGRHIDNTCAQLEAMIPYFEDPAKWRIATQTHSAHEGRLLCSALDMLQFQSNGDVTVCLSRPPVGNIREKGIRGIWEARPRWWEAGCCREAGRGAPDAAAASAPEN